MQDLREHLRLSAANNRRVHLSELVNSRFMRPYGWPAGEIILLLSQLVIRGELQCLEGGAVISKSHLANTLASRSRWKSVLLRPQERIDESVLKEAQRLGQELFQELGPVDTEGLSTFLRRHLQDWHDQLDRFQDLQRGGRYPGQQDTATVLSHVKGVLRTVDGRRFFAQFNEAKHQLSNAKQSVDDLRHFFDHQRPIWDQLYSALDKFRLNELELNEDNEAGGCLKRLREIRGAERPYGMIKEVVELARIVEEVNERLISAKRKAALDRVESARKTVLQEIANTNADADLEAACLTPLHRSMERVKELGSLAHIAQVTANLTTLKEAAFRKLKERDGNPTPLKKVREVHLAALATPEFLETEAEVDAFLEALEKELREAIGRNERVKIR